MIERQKPQFSGWRNILIHWILIGAIAGSLIMLLFIPVILLLTPATFTDLNNAFNLGMICIVAIINFASGLAVLDGKRWGPIGLAIGMTLATIAYTDSFAWSFKFLDQAVLIGLFWAFLIVLLFRPYWSQYE